MTDVDVNELLRRASDQARPHAQRVLYASGLMAECSNGNLPDAFTQAIRAVLDEHGCQHAAHGETPLVDFLACVLTKKDQRIAFLETLNEGQAQTLKKDEQRFKDYDQRIAEQAELIETLRFGGAFGVEESINPLKAQVERLQAQALQDIDERDRANDALQATHVALGGDGEWCAKPGQTCVAGETGDLSIDTPVLAAELNAEVAELKRELKDVRGVLRWHGESLTKEAGAVQYIDAQGGDDDV